MSGYGYSALPLLLSLSMMYGQPVLFQSPSFTITASEVIEGNYRAAAISAVKIHSSYKSQTGGQAALQGHMEPIESEWTLTRDVSGFPQYHSGQMIVDALYTKALEEMLLDIRTDGAFMAGAKWDGVWTRDISYSILLSLAILNPDAAKVSLKAKVKNNRIIQDTGTGGSWPVSTDRMTWTLAAWEVYVVTGDEEWLRYAYAVIKNSVEDDQRNAVNPATGLLFGESSFLDWREQTYPRWMDPKDIYMSQALGTNAVHYRAYQILAEMAGLCGDDPGIFQNIAGTIKSGMNKSLWLEEKGYYGQFLYGRTYQSVSSKSEALGEALSVLFKVAGEDRAMRIIASTPVMDYGIPCIYPQIPNIPPYHNNAVWPFVEAFWTWASARAGNERSVETGLASIYRAAALFNTNKENMVASTGDYAGTQINSDRQLWSVAGNLATIYRVFYGMTFTQDGILFSPFIPQGYSGNKSLKNFKYRDAVLTVNLLGTGNVITSVTMDTLQQAKAFIPAGIKGEHTFTIVLGYKNAANSSINLHRNRVAPETPMVRKKGGILRWNKVVGAKNYAVYKNGGEIARVQRTSCHLPADGPFAEYQVMAVDENGFESFLSEPLSVVPKKDLLVLDASSTKLPLRTEHTGFTKKGYIRLSNDDNQRVVFKTVMNQSGLYRIDARYANGNGPINTDNKCAIRTLTMNKKRAGAIIFPQRGTGNWSDWGYTNALVVHLDAGENELVLELFPFNTNMNVDINEALLDQLRLIKMTGMEE
ncbi:MAG: glycogen debranching protein [Ignavibacteriae bacterium]|nr:MAG: glycogen debranching protein [Ignavibacteriota bacterium]